MSKVAAVMAEEEKDERKQRYGSAKLDLNKVLGILKKSTEEKKTESKSFFELLKEEEEKRKSEEKPLFAEEAKPEEKPAAARGRGEKVELQEPAQIIEERQEAIEEKRAVKEGEAKAVVPHDEEVLKALKLAAERNKEATESINQLLNFLKQVPSEDPLVKMVRELSAKVLPRMDEVNQNLIIILKQLDKISSRLDIILGVEEKPFTKELPRELKKVALELEVLPSGRKLPLEKLAERVDMAPEKALEAVKELTFMGMKLEVVEEYEKQLGIFTKKITSVLKK